MANEVYDRTDITLQDGTDVSLRPLSIALLRKFMAAWEQINDTDNEMDVIDVFMDCSGVGLMPYFKANQEEYLEKFEKVDADSKSKSKFLDNKYREHLEEVLDMETIQVIMKVTGGVDLEQTAQAAAAAMMTTTGQGGQS